MSEHCKNGTLLALILTSLVLTSRLLFGQPALETAKPPAYEQLAFGDLKAAAEQVLPELRVRLEDNTWRLLNPWENNYRLTWREVHRFLLAAGSPEVAEAPLRPPEGVVLAAHFPAAVPPALYGAERLNGYEVDRLILQAAEPEFIWLRQATGSWHKARLWLPPEAVGELAATLADLPAYTLLEDQVTDLLTGEDLLFPLEPPKMAPRQVTGEFLPLEKLLRSIFVDTALVRLIEERDGALIYTDGQKGLRIFDHGEVELTSPHSEPGSQAISPLNALRRTAQFLQLLGGWPETLYLTSLQREESPAWLRRQWDSYTAQFTAAQHGFRVLGRRPPAKLRFTDRGVIYYNRQLRVLGDETDYPRPLIDPLEAVSVASRFWPQEVKRTELQSVFPVYYLRDSAAYPSAALPAWALRFDGGRTAVVHGFTGGFLAWLD
jgi:hypothetical protein